MPIQRRTGVAALLRQRLVSALHFGLVTPGERLPSSRELGRELAVDPRVVLAAYRDLAREGLVEFRMRSGVYVCTTALTRAERPTQHAEWAVRLFREALARGIPSPVLPTRLRQYLETVRLRAVCIECNDDQRDALCRELERDHGVAAESVELSRLDTRAARTRMRRADFLVTTSFHGDEVQAMADALGKPCFAVSLRPDVVAELTRLLADGPVYFLATDKRFPAKLRQMFAPLPHSDHLRPVLLNGNNGVSGIPPGAPIYVMSRAWDHLAHSAHRLRAIPLEQLFSVESSAALLTFIVRANTAALEAAVATSLER